MDNASFYWKDSLNHTYTELVADLLNVAPKLLGVLILLFAGLVLASILSLISKKLLEAFDRVFNYVAKTDVTKREKIKRYYITILSKVIFWVVILFFIAAAGNMLGWEMFTGWVDNIINYVPNFIAGLLVILVGFLLSNIVKTAITTTAGKHGLESNIVLGRSVQILIVITAIIIAASQIGINLRLLSNILITIIGILLAGGALAFGLGAKILIANVIGAQYMRKHCSIGEEVNISDVSGVVAEVTQTSIILETDEGRILVPAKMFQEHILHISSGVEKT